MKETVMDRDSANAADPKPTSVDVSEAGYETFLTDVAVEITARAEELHPGDPGQLSGAALTVYDIKEGTGLSAIFGFHNLGLLSGAPLLRFVSEALAIVEQGPKVQGACTAKLAELYPQIDGRLSGIDLRVSGAPEPTLKIMCGGHCFGVVHGDALRRFLDAALVRAAFGRAASPEQLAIAAEVIQACLGREAEHLGQVQRF